MIQALLQVQTRHNFREYSGFYNSNDVVSIEIDKFGNKISIYSANGEVKHLEYKEGSVFLIMVEKDLEKQ